MLDKTKEILTEQETDEHFDAVYDKNLRSMCVEHNLRGINKSTRYYDMPDGSRFNVTIKRISKCKK